MCNASKKHLVLIPNHTREHGAVLLYTGSDDKGNKDKELHKQQIEHKLAQQLNDKTIRLKKCINKTVLYKPYQKPNKSNANTGKQKHLRC